MQIIRDLASLPADARKAALAIGNFDGLHQGHRQVIRHMLAMAKEHEVPSAVMTFEPHPRMFFGRHDTPIRIEPFHVKARRLRAMRVEYLFVQRFTEAFSHLHASDFVQRVLVAELNVSHVVTGGNFVFGYQRSGDSDYLHRSADEHGFGFTPVQPFMVHGAPCSSSRIRQHLAGGGMEEVRMLLGRHYEMIGRVVPGDQRGRELGFPTANIIPAGLVAPAYGVYAVRFAEMADGQIRDDAVWHPGVANLGIRPTFAGEQPRLEVHALEASPELYGKRLRVQFIAFIRPEQVFDGPEQLKAQIAQDVETARGMLT